MSTEHHFFPCLKLVCREERTENLRITTRLLVFVLSQLSESSTLVLTTLVLKDLPLNVWFHNHPRSLLRYFSQSAIRTTILPPN